MIAPTSVSSRLSARPMTPLPKSNISLAIASVSPSIFATPSEHSRTTPTFCLLTCVFTPAICASISCNRLLISEFQCRFSDQKLASNSLNRAFTLPSNTSLPTFTRSPPISSLFTANERFKPSPYRATRLAFTDCCNASLTGVALSTRAERRSISSFANRRKCDRIATYPRGFFAMTALTVWRTRFSSNTPFTLQLEKSALPSRRDCLEIFTCCVFRFASSSQLPRRVFGQPALLFRGQNVSSHLRAGGDHEPADFLAQLRLHADEFRFIGLARFGDDVVGRG